MAIPITVPRLGWNMDEGVFSGWLKADGETVRSGEALFTLESDKATEDIECLDDGILHVPDDGPQKGDVLAVGTVIGYVLQPDEPIPTIKKPSLSPQRSEPMVAPTRTPTIDAPSRLRPASSPRARRMAAELGIDWRQAKPTGRTGRIRERDVLALNAEPVAVPPLRRIIAERMLTSARSTAPVTLTTTTDATELVHLRSRLKGDSQNSGDPAPTYTDLFVKLTVLALQKHPILNSRWEEGRIETPEEIHIGIAVDTEAGLVVPVVRDVAGLSLQELSIRSRDLIERARQRELSASELQGGTFTVTSLGAFGIDAFTPIINYPECAILGIGRIRRCPAVVGDQIAIRDQVALSLTFDHRITDGVPAARFLQTLSALIENPEGALK